MATDMIGTLGEQAGNFVNAGMVVLFIGSTIAILYGLFWLLKTRMLRYNYDVEIFKRDATGHIHTYKDKGGIYYDKIRELKLFYLKSPKNKSTGLSADFIPCIYNKDGKPKVYLLKTGEASYRYINYDTIKDQPEYFKITIGEEDTNTAIATMNAENNKYNTDMIKFWAITAIMFVMVLGIIFMGYSLNKGITEGFKSQAVDSSTNLEIETIRLNITNNLLKLRGLDMINGTTILR